MAWLLPHPLALVQLLRYGFRRGFLAEELPYVDGMHVLKPVTLRIYDFPEDVSEVEIVGLWQGAALILKLSLQVLLLHIRS
jgi:hypothetical protein